MVARRCLTRRVYWFGQVDTCSTDVLPAAIEHRVHTRLLWSPRLLELCNLETCAPQRSLNWHKTAGIQYTSIPIAARKATAPCHLATGQCGLAKGALLGPGGLESGSFPLPSELSFFSLFVVNIFYFWLCFFSVFFYFVRVGGGGNVENVCV